MVENIDKSNSWYKNMEEYIKSIGLKNIAEYEYFLKQKAIEGLKKIPNIVIVYNI